MRRLARIIAFFFGTLLALALVLMLTGAVWKFREDRKLLADMHAFVLAVKDFKVRTGYLPVVLEWEALERQMVADGRLSHAYKFALLRSTPGLLERDDSHFLFLPQPPRNTSEWTLFSSSTEFLIPGYYTSWDDHYSVADLSSYMAFIVPFTFLLAPTFLCFWGARKLKTSKPSQPAPPAPALPV